MPRTNLRKVKEAIDLAADAACSRIAAEREIDLAHIERHAEASRQQLDYLAAWETKLIDYVRASVSEMRQREQERLASLMAHADDIKDESEPQIAAPAATRQLRAAE
jgi:hypothetical protein